MRIVLTDDFIANNLRTPESVTGTGLLTVTHPTIQKSQFRELHLPVSISGPFRKCNPRCKRCTSSAT